MVSDGHHRLGTQFGFLPQARPKTTAEYENWYFGCVKFQGGHRWASRDSLVIERAGSGNGHCFILARSACIDKNLVNFELDFRFYTFWGVVAGFLSGGIGIASAGFCTFFSANPVIKTLCLIVSLRKQGGRELGFPIKMHNRERMSPSICPASASAA